MATGTVATQHNGQNRWLLFVSTEKKKSRVKEGGNAEGCLEGQFCGTNSMA
jgi:hypothetical protein